MAHADALRVIRLLQGGHTAQDIAATLGVTEDQVLAQLSDPEGAPALPASGGGGLPGPPRLDLDGTDGAGGVFAFATPQVAATSQEIKIAVSCRAPASGFALAIFQILVGADWVNADVFGSSPTSAGLAGDTDVSGTLGGFVAAGNSWQVSAVEGGGGNVFFDFAMRRNVA